MISVARWRPQPFWPALLSYFIAIVVIQYASIGRSTCPSCWTSTIMGIWLLKAMRDSFAVPWDTKPGSSW